MAYAKYNPEKTHRYHETRRYIEVNDIVKLTSRGILLYNEYISQFNEDDEARIMVDNNLFQVQTVFTGKRKENHGQWRVLIRFIGEDDGCDRIPFSVPASWVDVVDTLR